MKIRGVNFGGWLLMEGYILQARNRGESILKKEFAEHCGKKSLTEFEQTFRDNFIQEQDFKNVAAMGANTIRLPFNCRLVEKEPYKYSNEGLGYLEKALNLAEKSGLKIILDLHAAPGAQNHDWHGDSDGRALLWEKQDNRKRTYALWTMIADSFKDHPALLGYDVLNEAVIEKGKVGMLADFYKNCINVIRSSDKEHEIFLEGNTWAQQVDFLKPLLDDGITVSVHTYEPIYYTFNFTPFFKYPGTINEGFATGRWNKERLYKYLKPYRDFSKKHNTKIYVGEFGINWRGGFWGEEKWLDDILSVFDDFGFGYTYWTYKAIANAHFPDGIYQHIPGGKYVNRFGHEPGWECYKHFWKKEKAEFEKFFSTKSYTPNKSIINVLSRHFKR
jgi:aryl-phospho-beta-D-glucosidase BglC (GH1 family)